MVTVGRGQVLCLFVLHHSHTTPFLNHPPQPPPPPQSQLPPPALDSSYLRWRVRYWWCFLKCPIITTAIIIPTSNPKVCSRSCVCFLLRILLFGWIFQSASQWWGMDFDPCSHTTFYCGPAKPNFYTWPHPLDTYTSQQYWISRLRKRRFILHYKSEQFIVISVCKL